MSTSTSNKPALGTFDATLVSRMHSILFCCCLCVHVWVCAWFVKRSLVCEEEREFGHFLPSKRLELEFDGLLLMLLSIAVGLLPSGSCCPLSRCGATPLSPLVAQKRSTSGRTVLSPPRRIDASSTLHVCRGGADHPVPTAPLDRGATGPAVPSRSDSAVGGDFLFEIGLSQVTKPACAGCAWALHLASRRGDSSPLD